ncbi:MAG: radical SAM protein [Lachnospiraceae bacterium]|nr:radical SAM protein [Lachnospiraceae bacterium]
MDKAREAGYNILGEGALDCCRLCPHSCGVNRKDASGFCGCGVSVRAAKAQLHHWEEPCISGRLGSGAVFFSGCTLRCCYCQNYSISQQAFGKELSVRQLADIFLRLQEEGAHNINLVTATPYVPQTVAALDLVRHQLHIPIVYNCGGYERLEVVRSLKDYIDIWLPDLKYYDPWLSSRFSGVSDYFAVASQAITQMVRQTGPPTFFSAGKQAPVMKKGVIIRHLVLPGHRKDSIRLLHWLAHSLPKGHFYLSLLRQYTPYRQNGSYPELNRRVTSYEYDKVVRTALELGLGQGYTQYKNSAKQEYTPIFDLGGL